MGYESKVYIVQEYPKYYEDEKLPYGSVIAMFDLCKMGYSEYHGRAFRELFNHERTCEFYADDFDTVITEDYYGDEVTKAEDNKAVVKWMKAYIKDNDWYRAKVVLDTLLSLEKNNVEYSLYHFGY